MADLSQEHLQQVADEAEAAKHRVEVERLRQEQLRKQRERWENDLQREEEMRRERILAQYEGQRPAIQREVEQQVRRSKRNRVMASIAVLGSVGILAIAGGFFYKNNRNANALEQRYQGALEQQRSTREKQRENDARDKSSLLQKTGDLRRQIQSLQREFSALPPVRKK